MLNEWFAGAFHAKPLKVIILFTMLFDECYKINECIRSQCQEMYSSLQSHVSYSNTFSI